ncbi:MAG: type II toxin-antitoxin system RelE family toxin [Gammaproteobacteria bacterium]
MTWRIEWSLTASKAFLKLDLVERRRIAQYLQQRVAGLDDPRRLGRALKGEKRGIWRYRVGDYRLLCRIEDDRLRILVLKIGHRREVYR